MKIIHIVAKDGRYFLSEVDDDTSNEEIIRLFVEESCIPLKGIYEGMSNCGVMQPIWEAKNEESITND